MPPFALLLALALPAGAAVRLTVSNDPADGAQFTTIDAAVRAASEPGTTIAVYPGLQPYAENVVIDRPFAFTIEGVDDGSGKAVELDGGPAPSIMLAYTPSSPRLTLERLTFIGRFGVWSQGTLDARRLVFRDAGTAFEVTFGTARLVDSTITGAEIGVHTRHNTASTFERLRIADSITGVFVEGGTLSLVNTAITGSIDGLKAPNGWANIMLRHATFARIQGRSILANGDVVTIDRSAIARAGQGVYGVSCPLVTRSVLGDLDCSASGDNLFVDPMLGFDGGPLPGSPCIDRGALPPAAPDELISDVLGRSRRIDGNADGIARSDDGAFEYWPEARLFTDIHDLHWIEKNTIAWHGINASRYHQYRGPIASLSETFFGMCSDHLDTLNPMDAEAPATEMPAPGTGFFYLVTATDGFGVEGTLGLGTFAERSNFHRCPQ